MEYYCPSRDDSLSSASDTEEQESKTKRRLSMPRHLVYEYPSSYKVFGDHLVEYLEEAYSDEGKSLLSRAEWRPRVEDWRVLE